MQVAINEIRQTIHQHPDFVSYMEDMDNVFSTWKSSVEEKLISLKKGLSPKSIIHSISEELLSAYQSKALINKYDVYQHLMNYWIEVMQDDCYIIAEDGWNSNTHRVLVKATSGKNKGNKVDKGWDCDLIPKQLVINRYFANEQELINELNIKLEDWGARKLEMEEEHGGEDGFFAELEKINNTTIN